MKTFTKPFLSLILVLTLTIGNSAYSQTVPIPDSNFRAYLQANYPAVMSGNDLIISQAALITGNLHVENQGISDLTGIEYFTGISGLYSFNNNLSSIQGLGQLNLQLLETGYNQLTNLNGIENSTGLTVLHFENNQVTQLPDLSVFPGLQRLIISNNPFTANVLDVSANPLLNHLFIEHLGFTEIIGLNLLSNMLLFRAQDNNLSDVSGLAVATNLTQLNVDNNQLTSLDLTPYPNLTTTSIGYNPFTGSTLDLTNNAQLKVLFCQSANISEILGLGFLTQLQFVRCQSNNLASLSGIENATGLLELEARVNNISDFPIISNWAQMTYLNIDSNPISNTSIDVSNNVSMKVLGVHLLGNLEQITGLANLTQLKQLYVHGNQIQFLPGIQTISTLQVLSASDNILEELPDLSGATGLSNLRVFNNSLTFEDLEPNVFVPTFLYQNQSKFGQPETINNLVGQPLVLEMSTGGASNVYQWKKDGIDIPGATTNPYTIPSFNISDVGEYELTVTNTVVTNLTLTSELITVTEIPSFLIPDPVFSAYLNTWYPTAMNGDYLLIDEAHIITDIVLSNSGLQNLSGIQFITNLWRLRINGNQLTDISDIQALPLLTEFLLNNNQVTSLPDFSLFPILESIDISNNPWSGTSWNLSSNSSLKFIRMSNTSIEQITGLSGLTNLEEITASNSNLQSLTGIENALNLEFLSVDNTNVTVLPDLNLFPNLSWLVISGINLVNPIIDLSSNTQLVRLFAVSSGLSEITGLPGLGQLEIFVVNSNNLTSIAGIESAISLQLLKVANNNLTDLPTFLNFPNLSQVDISDNPFNPHNIDVSANPLISFFIAQSSNLQSVTGLNALTQLIGLNMAANNLTTVDGIQNAATLSTLNISDNQIIDLPDLSGIATITNASVHINRLTFEDIEPNLFVPNFNYSPQAKIGQPETLEGLFNQPLALEVVTGGANNIYQWKKDGVIIASATTNPYTLPAFTLSDVGTYELVITNSQATQLTLTSEPINVVEANQYLVPDPNFRAYLQSTYPQIMNGDYLLIDEALSIGSIIVSNLGIQSLDGIQFFTNLWQLRVDNNLLTDISLIQNLSNLSDLILNKNQLTTLPDFSLFPDLELLYIDRNPWVTTILDLAANQSLKYLRLQDTPTSQIDGLSGLVDLIEFRAPNTSLTTVTGIENASNLISIDINNVSLANPVLDLSGNPQLIDLFARNCGITQILGLSNMNQLVNMVVPENSLTSISGIENAPTMEVLSVRDNSLTSMPDITNFPSLVQLFISRNPFNLQTLDFSQSPIRLFVGENANIQNVIGLETLTELLILDISNNSVSSIAGIENSTTLEIVEIDQNQIDFLPNLSANSGIIRLKVANNFLTFEDLEPNILISNFQYTPQANVGAPQTIDLFSGETLDVTRSVGGTQNIYQWYKDGLPVTGATSDQLHINAVDVTDDGQYQLQVTNTLATDLTLLSEIVTVNVEAVPPLEITNVTSPLSSCGFNIGCNGDATATATVSFTGGQEPYSFLWSDGQTTATAVNLSASNYSVTVTDALDNSSTGNIILTEPSALDLINSVIDATCEDSSNGAIDITITGGCALYSFNWTGPDGFTATSEDLTGLIPGNYLVEVTDEQGCSINSGNITISSNPSPLVSISGAKTLFFGYDPMASADLSVAASGGLAPFIILWSTGETTEQITVIPQSSTSYSVTVTDANGCSSSADVFIPVVDVRCGNNLDKVLICHIPSGNPTKAKTLCISENAVDTHLSNGDFLGSCDGLNEPDGYQPFEIIVYPNPFINDTNIDYTILEEGVVNITVYDDSGYLLEIIVDGQLDPGSYSHTFDATLYPSSTLYYISVQYQGHEEVSQTYTMIRN